MRFDIATTAEARIRSSVAGALAPGLAALSDVGRVRFYGIDAVVSGIETAERGIYEGGPGSQRYLLLAECARPDVMESGDRRALWASLDEGAAGGDPPIAHVVCEAFRIDYLLPAG